MRVKEHFEDELNDDGFDSFEQEKRKASPLPDNGRKAAAKDFAALCWKTDMLNREIAAFLQISERKLYRYLSGTSKIPGPVVKLLTLKVDGRIVGEG